MKRNLLPLILSFSILLLSEACTEKKAGNPENTTTCSESGDHGTYVVNSKGNITVLYHPMDLGKYGCSLIFGGSLSGENFSKVFFSKNPKRMKGNWTPFTQMLVNMFILNWSIIS